MKMKKASALRRLAALAGVIALASTAWLLAVPGSEAVASQHAPAKYWEYDPGTANSSWRDSAKLVRADRRWHEKHPDATEHDERAFRKMLDERFMADHVHQTVSQQSGTASWYGGGNGACGGKLHGYFAASRTLPCGSLVSVRAGNGHYVFVTIEDRGPFTGGNRILDLSKQAFRQLAPLGSGVIHIKAARLKS
jgi:rare lipoprotein A (peptidoglycan hydrolase)